MIAPGARLDRYECLNPIGKGGMASVWVARLVGKHGFEKLVAIKTILPEHAGDPTFLKMFLDEAHILSGIRHPNVASVLDLGEQDGLFYLVFEWVEGEQLSKLRRALREARESIPLGVALRIAADTCAGLHAAHELCDASGWPLCVVHRDVSPQNIMLSVSGDVKIVDFGIAKALDRVAEDTVSGTLKGKSVYMAPECVRGEDIDRRVDIWAVGVVLYQLLANRLPLAASGQVELLRKLSSLQEPDPVPASLPPAVASVITKALRPKREERYQTAADMQRDLEQAIVALEGAVTASDVAAFSQKHLGSLIDAKREAIVSTLDRLASSQKHRAARDVIAALPPSHAPAADGSSTPPLRALGDASTSPVSVDATGSTPSGLSAPSEASPPAPADATRQPDRRAWLRSPRHLASAAAVTGLIALALIAIAGSTNRTQVTPARHVSFSAPSALVETVADRAAAAATRTAQQAPSASASAAPASSPSARPPKVPSRPPPRKDPMSVFGTR